MKTTLVFLLFTLLCTFASCARAQGADPCFLAPCHGLQLRCDQSAAGSPMCTEMYQLGDFCRTFAHCKKDGESCVLQLDKKFEDCKSCISACQSAGDGMQAFECEAQCREKIGN
jgi:hypothetical protein